MAYTTIGAIFTLNGEGVAGAAPTVSVEAVDIITGTPTLVVDAEAMTESANIVGYYFYNPGNIIDTSSETYLVYCTTAETVDHAHLYGEISGVATDGGTPLSQATMDDIADLVLTRDAANVDGEAAEHSLYTLVMGKLAAEISGGTLTIYQTDGTTVHITKTLTTDPAAELVTAIATPAP